MLRGVENVVFGLLLWLLENLEFHFAKSRNTHKLGKFQQRTKRLIIKVPLNGIFGFYFRFFKRQNVDLLENILFQNLSF